MRLSLTALTALLIQLLSIDLTAAQLCPSAEQCRKGPPVGNLRHEPNSAGQRVWTTPCGPNTNGHALDLICSDIASCTDAGAFGKFLKAVTGECRAKHFDGYFGLDGLTFGILDWTSSNLPGVLKAYQQRSAIQFAAHFEKLSLPLKNGCLDPKWVCQSNQRSALMCDAKFRSAFSSALETGDFRKAQMDYALAEYEKRLARYSHLGLKTEYGNTAIAVLANNLKGTASCRPSAWKDACKGRADERNLVDCMLEQYVKNECRGSLRGSRSRSDSIKAAFASDKDSAVIHPTASAVERCVADWGK